MKKKFKTLFERVGNIEIRYIAGEDFVEMGSIAGEQYLEAISFRKLYEKSCCRELFMEDRKFLLESLNSFIGKYGFDLNQKYPQFTAPAIEFYRKFDSPNEFSSLFLTIFSDYSHIWVRIEEVSHQTFYPEYHNSIILDAKTILHGLEKYEELSKKYRTKRFKVSEQERKNGILLA